jgi:S1-C subfamily serine protease
VRFLILAIVLVLSAYYPASASLLDVEKKRIEIYKNTVPSVVNVTSIRSFGHPFFGYIEKIPAGQGSGFVWDKKGHIVTNYHVVMEGGEFQISFYNDPKSYKAKVIGLARRKDIAVLKLQELPKSLTPVNPGISNNLQVGQMTLAIGNPFGLDHSMSSGIISALGRKIEGVGQVTIHNMIQTDAAINQGNSGGPLIDSSGKLIGMNTMIFSTSGSSAGLGFAVPVDTIKRIVPQLIEHGKEIRPSLGISLLDQSTKERFFGEKGIAVEAVMKNSPAEKAGLMGLTQDRRGRIFKGDLILAIDNKEVNSFDDIYHVLEKYKIGDSVKVKIKRDGSLKKLDIKLEAL